MKTILHIVQSPGGVERYIQIFLKNIDRQSFSNIIVCSNDYQENDYLEYVEAFENVNMIREIDVRLDIKAIILVRKLIKKYRPDIVYCHSSKAGAIGRIANIGISNKIIYNPHGWAFNMRCNNIKRNIYKFVEKVLSVFTDKIIAISEYEKNSALENKICRKEKIDVIYNGIDIEEYDKKKDISILSRKELGIPDEAYIIGFVGRLSEQKSPDTFIKVASKIKEKNKNAYFLMVGDGEGRPIIEKRIKEEQLSDSIIITGWVDNPMEYIMLFDQAMLLSRWEGFGLVLAEFMWAEKPIVATNVDAIPDLIQDGVNGLLVDVDDVETIVEASIKIWNNNELSNELIKNGKNIVRERFSIQRVIRQHEKLFSHLLQNN